MDYNRVLDCIFLACFFHYALVKIIILVNLVFICMSNIVDTVAAMCSAILVAVLLE